MRVFPQCALLAIFWAFTFTANAQINEFSCGSGHSYRSVLSKDKSLLLQWCIDADGKKQGLMQGIRLPEMVINGEFTYRNNQKNGPARLYNPKGQLDWQIEYENGAETTAVLTRDALQRIYEAENAKLGKVCTNER